RGESGLVSDWVYDGATYGVGLPQKACTSASSNSTCTSATTTRVFTYDTTSRPSTTAITVDSTTYTYTTTYNATNGAIDTVTAPSGLVTKDFYNSYGYLCRVTDNGGSHSCSSTSDSHVLWTATSGDAELHLTGQTAGNAAFSTAQTFDPNTGLLLTIGAGTSNAVAQFTYTYDTLGNLSSRVDSDSSVYEKFCYDSLNRLTNSATASSPPTLCTSTGGGITSKTIAYDSLGNITSKNDVGTYAYPSSGGGTGSRPHAVSSITGTVNGVTNPSYTYDSNGNMTAGAGRSVTYTAFNMAASIVQGSTANCLTYDDSHGRIKLEARATNCSGTLSSTTTYLNDPFTGAMSEKLVAAGSTIWHDFLRAGGIVGERFYTVGGSTVWKYFVADHLGSVAVVTDSSGTVSERLSYDAWGRRRNSDGTDDSTCSITSATTRGYTGHEMMDSICEINANARIYDPTIGRFMSADTMVPDPFDGQSFNRYSYVGNNPLSATDPSGHDNFCANGTASGNTNGSGCPPVYDDGYGPPPWGDEGPGLTERANGSITSAESQGFGSKWIPGIGTVTGRQDELTAYNAQLIAEGLPASASGSNSGTANGSATSGTGGASGCTASVVECVLVTDTAIPNVIFINGFNAQGSVNAYINNLLQNRPELIGRVAEYSYLDSVDSIVKYAESLSGKIVLIANSLGAGHAALVVIDCHCITTLITLAPVAVLQTNFAQIANNVRTWIDMETPLGSADITALTVSLGNIGPWGDGPRPYVTTFISNPPGISHADFWPQMDIACKPNMTGC
ncbi:MAG TPA: RHS repeat-associated core domain-containing protein, partial [Rhizomicrobium sp.]